MDNRLAALVKDKTLFRATTGVYEFRRSEATDFESMIEEYKADPDNQPADLAREVVELYEDASERSHIKIRLEAPEPVAPAPAAACCRIWELICFISSSTSPPMAPG